MKKKKDVGKKDVGPCWICNRGRMIEREGLLVITVACSTKGCPAVYTKKKRKD